MYDVKLRNQKANKMLAVLGNYYGRELRKLSVLDIGCSTGIISHYLSKNFTSVTGIDIDISAINYAANKWKTDKNLKFCLMDAMNIGFPDESFDVIICASVYEHVPDYYQLMKEIKRVLKPDGICFFTVGNRFRFMEPHYHLPFLSCIPKPLSHLYLRIFGKGKYYYENLLSYWGAKRLVKKFNFNIVDYTSAVIHDPQKYSATEIIKPDSLKQKIAIFVIHFAYCFFPVYIWLLSKNKIK